MSDHEKISTVPQSTKDGSRYVILPKSISHKLSRSNPTHQDSFSETPKGVLKKMLHPTSPSNQFFGRVDSVVELNDNYEYSSQAPS